MKNIRAVCCLVSGLDHMVCAAHALILNEPLVSFSVIVYLLFPQAQENKRSQGGT
jgi:hypothetical protein